MINSKLFDFLNDLSTPRDKPWFDENRERYRLNVLEPLRSLVLDVGPSLQAIEPEMEISPKVNKTITRINRDIRFVKKGSAYKDHILILFYRIGRKKQDAQLFLGFMPSKVWLGLYVPEHLLGDSSPIANALSQDPASVLKIGRKSGVGSEFELVTCQRFGSIETLLEGASAVDYRKGPHLCVLKTIGVDWIAENPDRFVKVSEDLLVKLIPIWRLYSG